MYSLQSNKSRFIYTLTPFVKRAAATDRTDDGNVNDDDDDRERDNEECDRADSFRKKKKTRISGPENRNANLRRQIKTVDSPIIRLGGDGRNDFDNDSNDGRSRDNIDSIINDEYKPLASKFTLKVDRFDDNHHRNGDVVNDDAKDRDVNNEIKDTLPSTLPSASSSVSLSNVSANAPYVLLTNGYYFTKEAKADEKLSFTESDIKIIIRTILFIHVFRVTPRETTLEIINSGEATLSWPLKDKLEEEKRRIINYKNLCVDSSSSSSSNNGGSGSSSSDDDDDENIYSSNDKQASKGRRGRKKHDTFAEGLTTTKRRRRRRRINLKPLYSSTAAAAATAKTRTPLFSSSLLSSAPLKQYGDLTDVNVAIHVVDSLLGYGFCDVARRPFAQVYNEYERVWRYYDYGVRISMPSAEDYVRLYRFVNVTNPLLSQPTRFLLNNLYDHRDPGQELLKQMYRIVGK